MLLLERIIKSIIDIPKNFLVFWYREIFFLWKEKGLKIFFRLEKFFAVKINLHYLFTPLYQDYTLIGYLFGFPLRLTRIILGTLFYLIFFVFWLLLYLLWAAIPFYLFLKGIKIL